MIGATGAVGQTTLKILEQRKFPVRELRAYASARSAGKTVTFAGESIPVQTLDANSFKGIDLVLFSAGTEQSREFAPIAVKAGADRNRQVQRVADGSRRAAGGARD